ncbi:MAG TPA: hypothetical protein VFK05_11160 [Polyangiaceae bacterium]|nr:hypothetical protein [Polyangiaceae bacterium]
MADTPDSKLHNRTGEPSHRGLWQPKSKPTVIQGDLWQMHDQVRVVVTTNIGWDLETYQNNMGAGVALQAARRWPELPEWYGRQCARLKEQTPVLEYLPARLILLPVKPLLYAADPERSWDQEASLELIDRSLAQLAEVGGDTRIALAFPGCGNGGLKKRAVLPLIERHLKTDQFVVVDREAVPNAD